MGDDSGDGQRGERGAVTGARGVLLRANHVAADPAELWRWYVQWTQAEAAFRVEKSDLGLRPVFHQKAKRVQAHILVCFVALALWRVLEQWMASKGLGTCARQLLKELDELHSMDVMLPTDSGVELRLRVVAQPEKELGQLLGAFGVEAAATPEDGGKCSAENRLQKVATDCKSS